MKGVSTVMIVILLIVAAGGFYGGIKFQEYQATKNRGNAMRQFQIGNGPSGQGMQRNGNGGQRNGFRPVNGEIIASDEKSITVKLQDGSSRIVLLNDKTQINKADIASQADLKIGEKVAVFGSDNTDGSVTAQNVQLNPLTRMSPTNGTPSAMPTK